MGHGSFEEILLSGWREIFWGVTSNGGLELFIHDGFVRPGSAVVRYLVVERMRLWSETI
jgi:hypothetical protein